MNRQKFLAGRLAWNRGLENWRKLSGDKEDWKMCVAECGKWARESEAMDRERERASNGWKWKKITCCFHVSTMINAGRICSNFFQGGQRVQIYLKFWQSIL